MQDRLINYIKTKVRLSEADEELLRHYFEPVLYPRNRILEEADTTPRYLYYILSGYLRLFHYNTEGDEVTTHLNCPPGFITPYRSFISQTRSHENLQTITDSTVLRISKEDLDYIMSQSANLKDFSIIIIQDSITYNENRSTELATLTAEKRYLKLIEAFPDILHNVPVQYIASFLGMKPESLSRIRKKLIS